MNRIVRDGLLAGFGILAVLVSLGRMNGHAGERESPPIILQSECRTIGMRASLIESYWTDPEPAELRDKPGVKYYVLNLTAYNGRTFSLCYKDQDGLKGAVERVQQAMGGGQ